MVFSILPQNNTTEKSLKEYKAKGLVDRTFSIPCRPGKVKQYIKDPLQRLVTRNRNWIEE